VLIDSHCHLTYEPLAQMRGDVLCRAAEAGVTHMISIGTDITDTRAAIELCHTHANIFASSGVHPHQAGKVEPGWEADLRSLAGHARVVAIGETGLDYHYDFSPRDRQREVFERQLSLATEIGKPVVIHCREAHADVMAVLAGFSGLRRVVFHCFTGTRDEAREIIDRGYWISLTGVVTFKNSHELQEVARQLPPDRIMMETDSPYLSPEPVRSRRPNEPALVVHVARRVSELRGMPFEEFAALTRANTIRFFDLRLD
jgi:TatD DNase family protein